MSMVGPYSSRGTFWLTKEDWHETYRLTPPPPVNITRCLFLNFPALIPMQSARTNEAGHWQRCTSHVYGFYKMGWGMTSSKKGIFSP